MLRHIATSAKKPRQNIEVNPQQLLLLDNGIDNYEKLWYNCFLLVNTSFDTN